MKIYSYKRVGETVLELRNRVAKKLSLNKLAYAGRLDPMAHGTVLFLTGKHLKEQEKYFNSDKTYRFNIVVGLATDTDDLLGIVESTTVKDVDHIVKAIYSFPDRYQQSYHNFSSYVPQKRHSDGKRYPLWWWSSRGERVTENNSKEVTIHSRKVTAIENIDDFYGEIIYRLNRVKDSERFRGGDIREVYNCHSFRPRYTQITVTLSVSSGFYIRQFVRDLSRDTGASLVVKDLERVSYCRRDFKGDPSYTDSVTKQE